eukprot:9011704-Prorocentrum_lima.AAC.1
MKVLYPKDMGHWWTGSTWFKSESIPARYQSSALESLLDNSVHEAWIPETGKDHLPCGTQEHH